jgi:hypothetical protein
MATRAAVFVEDGGLGLPIPSGPFHIEVWRVATATAGDTSVIAPKRGRFIQAAIGQAHNLSTSGNATNVTMTLQGPGDTLLLVQE